MSTSSAELKDSAGRQARQVLQVAHKVSQATFLNFTCQFGEKHHDAAFTDSRWLHERTLYDALILPAS